MADTITRILVPVDFSPRAHSAVRYAAALARQLNARLELLHVVEDPFLTGAWSAAVYAPNITELMANLSAGAEQQVSALKAEAEALGVTAGCAVVTGGPAHMIVEQATTGGFDLIVMSTHGRTGLAHAVMGSVAERVLRKAPCPVLTVKVTDAAAADAITAAA